MNVNYYLEKGRIRLQCSLPSGRFRYFLDETPSNWDSKKQRDKKNQSLNSLLNQLSIKCQEFRRQLIIEERLNSDNFRAALNEYLGRTSNNKTIIEYTKKLQAQKNNNPTYSKVYYHSFEMLISNLELFGDKKLANLKPSYVVDFNSYVLNKGYSISSAKLMYRLIKHVLNEAFNNDDFNVDPRRFKVKFGRNELLQPRLTLQEIKLIEKCDLIGLLDLIRNEFLLGIYTGARFSDWSKFSSSNFAGNQFVYESKKTGMPVKLKLSKKLKNVIIKLESQRIEFASKSETANYQRFLTYVKIVCKKSEINTSFKRKEDGVDKEYEKWQLIKSHTARRTFCALMLEDGHNLRDILPYSGHLSLQSLERYLMAAI